MPFASAVADLFRLAGPISRSRYAAIGFGLAAAKYAIDATIVYFMTGEFWHPLRYLNPLLSSRLSGTPYDDAVLVVLLILAIPFVWIGLALTFRRLIDAGRNPWLSLLYFVPLVNYVLLIVLCALPTAPPRAEIAGAPRAPHAPFLTQAIRGFAASIAITIVAALLSAYVFRAYGAQLFFGTPVIIGAILGFTLNHRSPKSVGATLGVVVTAILLSGASLLVFAIEGALCIMMAAPLAVFAAALGALVGRAMAKLGQTPPYRVAGLVLAIPSLSGLEAAVSPDTVRREVVSSIEVDAPPDRVWPLVVGFSELAPPDELLFRAGIAYPIRARIEGSGVGAVRYCEFSTGPFVEPITRFEPPHRLSFDVRAQPLPMKEWSPYPIHPPHLDGYFRSVAGEFRLVDLGSGRTRLEGSTWYELDMAPLTYWTPLADSLIHAIHLRVLRHIRALATR
jgi:uncharacterized membrane protein YhaH (DUF805 family)